MYTVLIQNVLLITSLNIDDDLPPLVRLPDDEDLDDENECA